MGKMGHNQHHSKNRLSTKTEGIRKEREIECKYQVGEKKI